MGQMAIRNEAFHENRSRSFFLRRKGKVMTVEPLSRKRDEQRVHKLCSRIRRDERELPVRPSVERAACRALDIR
jgi:hypothetical protein